MAVRWGSTDSTLIGVWRVTSVQPLPFNLRSGALEMRCIEAGIVTTTSVSATFGGQPAGLPEPALRIQYDNEMAPGKVCLSIPTLRPRLPFGPPTMVRCHHGKVITTMIRNTQLSHYPLHGKSPD